MPEETDQTTTDECYSNLVHEHMCFRRPPFSGEGLRKKNGASLLFFGEFLGLFKNGSGYHAKIYKFHQMTIPQLLKKKPSGKRLHNHGKSSILNGKIHELNHHFQFSHVCLPEGN